MGLHFFKKISGVGGWSTGLPFGRLTDWDLLWSLWCVPDFTTGIGKSRSHPLVSQVGELYLGPCWVRYFLGLQRLYYVLGGFQCLSLQHETLQDAPTTMDSMHDMVSHSLDLWLWSCFLSSTSPCKPVQRKPDCNKHISEQVCSVSDGAWSVDTWSIPGILESRELHLKAASRSLKYSQSWHIFAETFVSS